VGGRGGELARGEGAGVGGGSEDGAGQIPYV